MLNSCLNSKIFSNYVNTYSFVRHSNKYELHYMKINSVNHLYLLASLKAFTVLDV